MLPRSVLLISSGELAERFAFYGLSALLPLLLLSWNVGEDSATSLLSLFRAIAYLSPVVGSIIADGVLGKFRTIVVGLCAYAVGMALATGSSLLEAHWPFGLALILVALSTGCIKSVVAALLGEQVNRWQECLFLF